MCEAIAADPAEARTALVLYGFTDPLTKIAPLAPKVPAMPKALSKLTCKLARGVPTAEICRPSLLMAPPPPKTQSLGLEGGLAPERLGRPGEVPLLVPNFDPGMVAALVDPIGNERCYIVGEDFTGDSAKLRMTLIDQGYRSCATSVIDDAVMLAQRAGSIVR